MVHQEDECCRMLTINTSRICILALQYLWLAWNWNTKVVDVLDILQRNTILYQNLGLIERLFIYIQVKMLVCLDCLKMNFLEIFQVSANVGTVSCSISV